MIRIVDTDGATAFVERPIESRDYDAEGHVSGRHVESVDTARGVLVERQPLNEAIERFSLSPMLATVQGCEVCLDGVRWDGDDSPAFCACPEGVALRARAAA